MLNPLDEVARLCKALDARTKGVQTCEDWYAGDHPIPAPPPGTAAEVDRRARAAFDEMARLAITNLIPPIVKEPAKKLRVEGFTFGETATSTDVEAWRIWQRNYLDADAPMAFHQAVKTGQAFGIVWADKNGLATIDLEDPTMVIVAYEPGGRRRRRSALKRWVDEDGNSYATLYTPDAIYKFWSPGGATAAVLTWNGATYDPSAASGGWEPRLVDGEAWPLNNPLGVVPVVELKVNASMKPSTYGGGVSQFAGQIREQRKINTTVMNMLITLENQAFRQRWSTNWDYPLLPDGTPDLTTMAKFSAARIAAFEGDGVKVGEFAQADFRPFLDVLTYFTKIIAFSSSTPPHAFLLGEMVNVAADSLARLDSTHIAEVRSLADSLGEGCEELMRLALAVENNPKASDMSSAVTWAEFEQRTATEQMSVAKDLDTLGATKETVFAAVPGFDQTRAHREALQAAGTSTLRQALSASPTGVPAA